MDIHDTRRCKHGLLYDDLCVYCEVEDAKWSISSELRLFAAGKKDIPDSLKTTPFAALLAIADWIDTPNS